MGEPCLCMRQMGMLCLTACFRILGSSVAAETSLMSFAPASIAAEATHDEVVSIEMIGFWLRWGKLLLSMYCAISLMTDCVLLI